MQIRRPEYYDDFHCLAGSCPDSCCQEWEVDVDEDKAALYRALPGPLGDRLRQVLRDADGYTCMTIQDGRCPMWRSDGLCRIQAELGEGALCTVCREFPRLTHDYGDFVELGLELSCPEAARLILAAGEPEYRVEIAPDAPGDYDEEAMQILRSSRETALELLKLPAFSMGERLAILLLYGSQVQSQLDGGEAWPLDPAEALAEARSLAGEGDLEAILAFFRSLEQLTPRWGALLQSRPAPALGAHCAALARYLVERYWLQAVSDYDLYCRVKFVITACLTAGSLGENETETAQLFSKEIENDADNVDALLDAAYTHPAFTDSALLGLLRAV